MKRRRKEGKLKQERRKEGKCVKNRGKQGYVCVCASTVFRVVVVEANVGVRGVKCVCVCV
jgi:hypothetical protein